MQKCDASDCVASQGAYVHFSFGLSLWYLQGWDFAHFSYAWLVDLCRNGLAPRILCGISMNMMPQGCTHLPLPILSLWDCIVPDCY